jgi:hypothetical protein
MTIEELGRRVVACRHWRWMAGMMTDSGEHVFAVDNKDDVKHIFVLTPGQFVRSLSASARTPRLDDPATLGCLLALMREAWTRDADFNEWVAYAVPIFDGLETWRVGCIVDCAKMFAVCDTATMKIVEAATEAEALVAALEAAP